MILRSALICFTILSVLLPGLQILAAPTRNDDCLTRIEQELGPRLSSKASIVYDQSVAPRWSSYHAPRPGAIVNVAEERDVVETVKYCIKNNIEFLTQSGGHAHATTFNIGKKDIIINMRGLKQISVNKAKDQITFEGGAVVGEMWAATAENGVQTTIPTCNCVGMSGATLGGGFNGFISRYGLVIDNLLSINLVTAKGKLITVTPTSSPDLWWALRGAGANFGVVTSMTMKAYPPVANGIGFFATLVFNPDKLETLVQAYAGFKFTKEMYSSIYFQGLPPDMTPSLQVVLFYTGTEAEARAAYKAIYDVGPESETASVLPYGEWSANFDFECDVGHRWCDYTAGLKKLDPKIYRKIWNEYLSVLTQYPELNRTQIITQMFSTEVFRSVPASSSAFPHRDINFLTETKIGYDDARLDPIAERFGRKVRELLQEGSGFKELKAYVNYAHGDESPKAVYGDSLTRLKSIKNRWDKEDRFSQFIPIP